MQHAFSTCSSIIDNYWNEDGTRESLACSIKFKMLKESRAKPRSDLILNKLKIKDMKVEIWVWYTEPIQLKKWLKFETNYYLHTRIPWKRIWRPSGLGIFPISLLPCMIKGVHFCNLNFFSEAKPRLSAERNKSKKKISELWKINVEKRILRKERVVEG